MYLRAKKRIKDGKEHRYWSIVESYRNLADAPGHAGAGSGATRRGAGRGRRGEHRRCATEVAVAFLEDGGCRIKFADASLVARLVRRDGARVLLNRPDRIVSARVGSAHDALHVLHDGRTVERTYSVTLPCRAVEDARTGHVPQDW